MNVISHVINKQGKQRITVVIEADEQLIAINPDLFYKLGYPIEDVMQGHILAESVPVVWCSIEQKWID